ncbi:MAG: putative ABC transporter permease [Clostridia bacterium]|nr:putative ABC transporter permease [Clostridia bacterium]
MNDNDVLSAADRMKIRTEEIRRRMTPKINALENGGLNGDQREKLLREIGGEIAQLRKEQRRMAGCMAEEETLLDELETRYKEMRRACRRGGLFAPGPTNAQIEYREASTNHFARGRSPYKLFWVFFVGCFAGVLVEQAWCLIRYGVFEPRVGLIYGPFNLVYGIGAWALTAALYPFRSRSNIYSFLGGALVGSAVEYLCSLLQEMLFGSVSWDYSHRPFNLHGRICLQYSVYWGILGVIWIKSLYPRVARLILRIPNSMGRVLTAALAVFMVVNTLMTGLTVMRWAARRSGAEPAGPLQAYLDLHYPDEKLERMFSNLVFLP